MSIESDFIWLDGGLVPFASATTHILSHTLHYGMGAFEGIRAYPQADGTVGIWRLEEHVKRLLDTMKILRMPTPFTHAQIVAACIEVMQANHFDEAYIRPLAFVGMGKMGLGARDNPIRLAIAAWKWGAYLGEEGVDRGADLRTSSYARNHPNAQMSRAKVVGHYVNSIVARYEASDDGFDEALMLDANGYVAEGTGENVFVIRNKTVKTPPSANILPGITRSSVIEILRDEGFDVQEAFFGRDAFYVADEAFVCGTAAEITPVRSLDRRVLGEDGTPGAITKFLRQRYADVVRGKVERYQHHITKVALKG